MMAKKTEEGGRPQILKEVQTPLGFYVLTLLIIESTLTVVLTMAGFDEGHKWDGFVWMIVVFAAVVIIVTIFFWRDTRILLFGKNELPPQTAPSAIRDQIEDIIQERVKKDCLIDRKS